MQDIQDKLDSQLKLRTDYDYILLKRFGYSLKRLLARYPDGVPDELAAQALGLTLEELEQSYQGIVLKLRDSLGVEL